MPVMGSNTAHAGSGLRKVAGRAACAALLGWFSPQSHAGEVAPDPVIARGEQLARSQCSACHLVANEQQLSPLRKQPTPSFYVIAQRPNTSEKSLRHFIATTHWDMKSAPMTMPDQSLTDDQQTAVARYILSLRKR
jgi:mono/diheme cytochrome c family protein